MSGDIKRVLEVNQIDNLQGSTQRVKQETTLNNLRGITQRVYVVGGGSAPAHYIERTVDANRKLVGGSIIIDLTGVSDIGDYMLYYAYYNNTTISGTVDFSDLTTATGNNCCNNAFSGCTGITGVNLSSLATISGTNAFNNAFMGCTGITSINLSALTTVSGSCSAMFRGCSGITSANLSALTTVSGTSALNSMFRDCTGLTSVNLSSLTSIPAASAFVSFVQGCPNLTSLSFPAITTNSFGSSINQFNNMVYGLSGITLHFPSNVQAKIESLQGYSTTAPFGAISGTVLFDLPATE